MSSAICTISTKSHLFKVRALFDSLSSWLGENHGVKFICWCIDYDFEEFGEIDIISYEQIQKNRKVRQVFDKYENNKDHTRWSLKPVLIGELLQTHEKVIYLDNDLGFFSGPSFLFDELDSQDILLTAHNYPRNPNAKQNWLEANFKVGLYNAGFIAVNRHAKHIMDWWADCCLYRCEKSLIRGLFDDQKYLDLVPVMHPKTKVLEHLGCNVAGWNVDICSRKPQEDGSVLINGKWPIVFVHFNGFSIRAIIQGEDPLLLPYYEEYVYALKRFEPQLQEESLWNESTYWDQFKLKAWRLLNKLQKK